MNTCQTCLRLIQCVYCAQPLLTCAYCSNAYGSGSPNVICQHCYIDNTIYYYQINVGQQITCTLPQPTSGQVLTFTGNQGTWISGSIYPIFAQEEMIFMQWMDGRSDIELVEHFMKNESYREISLDQFEKLCHRFRPTLTPEVIQKIIKLKAFL